MNNFLKYLPNDIDFSIRYLEPQYPINDDWTNLKSKTINFSPIVRSICKLCNGLKTDILNKTLKGPEHYQWNLYEQLGIPSRSYIEHNKDDPDNNIFYFLLSTIEDCITFPAPDCTFKVASSQKENLFMYINNSNKRIPNDNSHYAYKIHLVCKPDYILYAFMKLLYLRDLEISGQKYRLQTKVNIDSRAHLPSEGDSGLLSDELNGGAAPTIVIYAGEDRNIAKTLIQAVLELFRDDAHRIGGMVRLDVPFSIPTFNVRLNPLIAYASGDRATRLDLRRANAGLREYNPEYPKGSFKTPDWVNTYRESCTKETADDINTQALRFFGHPLCTPEGSPAPDPAPCGICYMTSPRQEPMISPFELTVAPAPAAAAPAPAPAPAACGGAGCGASAAAAATASPRRGGSRHAKRHTKRYKTRRR